MNYSVLFISMVLFLLAVIGNIRMWQYSRYRKRITLISSSDIFFYYFCSSNILSCLFAIPFHITKLLIDNDKNLKLSSYFCLLRYLFTMISTDMSLLSLVALLVARKEKITHEPFSLKTTFSRRNINIYLVMGVIVTLIPNAAMAVIYSYILFNGNVYPCEKNPEKNTIQSILSICESIKTTCIAGPSVFVIIRSLIQLRNKLLERTGKSIRMKKCIRKIRISFGYAIAFLVSWVPFGCMALASGRISTSFYNTWFDIGYTISYVYLVAVPIICYFSDMQFQMRQQKTVKLVEASTRLSRMIASESRF